MSKYNHIENVKFISLSETILGTWHWNIQIFKLFKFWKCNVSIVRKRYKAIMITESTCKNCWSFFPPANILNSKKISKEHLFDLHFCITSLSKDRDPVISYPYVPLEVSKLPWANTQRAVQGLRAPWRQILQIFNLFTQGKKKEKVTLDFLFLRYILWEKCKMPNFDGEIEKNIYMVYKANKKVKG